MIQNKKFFLTGIIILSSIVFFQPSNYHSVFALGGGSGSACVENSICSSKICCKPDGTNQGVCCGTSPAQICCNGQCRFTSSCPKCCNNQCVGAGFICPTPTPVSCTKTNCNGVNCSDICPACNYDCKPSSKNPPCECVAPTPEPTPTATPCTCGGQPLGTRRCSSGTALEVCDDAYQPPPCSWHYYPCATGVCDPNPTPHCVEPTGTPIIPIAPED